MPTVNFSNVDVQMKVSHKKIIKQIIVLIFEAYEQPLISLQYIFCSDDYLLKINKEFLQHDYYTDIVTFDLSEKDGTVGEIYISIERVMENAMLLNIPQEKELQRVIFHGALHLCGLKDKTKSEILKMRDQEDKYLRLLVDETQHKKQ